ncbi:MAG: replication protein RepA [Candidatus Aenigmatarchaeota archaeon]
MPSDNSKNQVKKRVPSAERRIADISPDKDIRVRLLGTVLDASESTILLDDGTGKAEVQFDSSEEIAGLERGQLVRVVARVLPLIDGFALRGEAVQDMSGFDMQLYKRARGIIST